VLPINSPYFSISGWRTQSLASDRVAPGMEVAYLLKFTPEEKVDYAYDLICRSEREQFIVPIRATGARALLDFPDYVPFNEVPVRYKSSKTLLVRNIGNRDAVFEIKRPSEECPFDLSPDQGFLKAGDSLQLQLHFEPKVPLSYLLCKLKS
jgi:hydrocephalus-inducing protein